MPRAVRLCLFALCRWRLSCYKTQTNNVSLRSLHQLCASSPDTRFLQHFQLLKSPLNRERDFWLASQFMDTAHCRLLTIPTSNELKKYSATIWRSGYSSVYPMIFRKKNQIISRRKVELRVIVNRKQIFQIHCMTWVKWSLKMAG